MSSKGLNLVLLICWEPSDVKILFVCLAEFIQLFETMSVDDFLQFPVVVVVDARFIATDFQQLAVLLRIWMPIRDALHVRIAVVSKLCPDVAHDGCPLFVGIESFLRQLVLIMMQDIETILQLGAMG